MSRRLLLLALAITTALPAFGAEIAAVDRRSGYTFMGPDSRAMQDDDTANPGMLAVQDGEALWNAKAGQANRSCADCHGDASSMKGIAARYPVFDKALGRPVDLEQRINICRRDHQQASPFANESPEQLAVTAFIGRQSRGQPITSRDDEALAPFVARGHALFVQRQGQLNLACANCHEDNWDKHLAGSPVTQGQPNGYPEYRLEWQAMGSLQRRIRSCMTGIRAQALDYGSDDMVALELYLMSRARGMTMETPAVRP
jgi:L-cysteine S-thiosulfotransferase